MKRFLLWLWQLPQHIFAGFFKLYWLLFDNSFWTSSNKSNVEKQKKDGATIYIIKETNFAGVSLGEYIFIGRKFYNQKGKTVVNHEYGHTKQSRMLGPFYLIIIGIPSFIRNRHAAIKISKAKGPFGGVSKEDYEKITKWYYSRYPENWADKLGNVRR